MRLERERVVALRDRVVGFQHHQLGRGAQDWQLHSVVHEMVGRVPVVLVAQGMEEAAAPAALRVDLAAVDRRGGLPELRRPGPATFRPSLEPVAEASVVAGQGAEGRVGRRLLVRSLLLPLLHGFLDVAGEDLGQVVVAVELVLVVDAGEGGGGEGHGGCRAPRPGTLSSVRSAAGSRPGLSRLDRQRPASSDRESTSCRSSRRTRLPGPA